MNVPYQFPNLLFVNCVPDKKKIHKKKNQPILENKKKQERKRTEKNGQEQTRKNKKEQERTRTNKTEKEQKRTKKNKKEQKKTKKKEKERNRTQQNELEQKIYQYFDFASICIQLLYIFFDILRLVLSYCFLNIHFSIAQTPILITTF